jgi:hypothetical protein
LPAYLGHKPMSLRVRIFALCDGMGPLFGACWAMEVTSRADRPEQARRFGANTSPAIAGLCQLSDGIECYWKDLIEPKSLGQPGLLEVATETTDSKPFVEALLRLAGLVGKYIEPGPANGSVNLAGSQFHPFEVAPRSQSIPNGFPLQEAPKAQQDGCESAAKRSHFNKIVASLNANNVLQGKGRKNRRSATFKTLLRRCQSRPKHCLGETYADHFLATLGCFVGPSLLAISLVARGQSAR